MFAGLGLRSPRLQAEMVFLWTPTLAANCFWLRPIMSARNTIAFPRSARLGMPRMYYGDRS